MNKYDFKTLFLQKVKDSRFSCLLRPLCGDISLNYRDTIWYDAV